MATTAQKEEEEESEDGKEDDDSMLEKDSEPGEEGMEGTPMNMKQCWTPPKQNSKMLMDAIQHLAKRTGDKCLNLVFCGRITAMLAFLWHYTAPGGAVGKKLCFWATAAGKGHGLACSLHIWVWEFLEDNTQLPVSLYGCHNKSQLQDEDLAEDIHLHLQGLGKKYLSAMDIIRYLSVPNVKVHLKLKKTPSEHTAHRWMHAMNYHYNKQPTGMYINGHEHKDVVEYHQEIFLPLWAKLGEWMMTWTNDGVQNPPHAMPTFPFEKQVVQWTHDESIFYTDNCCKSHWVHADKKPELVKQGEGVSIMVSDFCSPDLGWLKSKDK